MRATVAVLCSLLGRAGAQDVSPFLGSGCTSNELCSNHRYPGGTVLEVDGARYHTVDAAVNETTGELTGEGAVTYCAWLNGTAAETFTACVPCTFETEEEEDPYAPAHLRMIPAANKSCYSFNGLFMPVGVEAGDPTSYPNIRDAGCGVCDVLVPVAQQGGVAGTTCFVHEDCREGFFCDLLVASSDSCGLSQIPALALNNECNEPFLCDIGTDATDCPQYKQVCVGCSDDVGWGSVHCHSLTPVELKNFILQSSTEQLAMVFTLVACTLVYPCWCAAVFILKNSTRCCVDGAKKHSWGM